MGNLLSTNKHRANIYEPFANQSVNYLNHHPEHQPETHTSLAEQIKGLKDKNQMLEEELRILKRELDLRTSRIETSMQTKYNELSNAMAYYNEKHNEKIGIITKDMENLLNNDKILLDKLIEKNIVSTIQDA